MSTDHDNYFVDRRTQYSNVAMPRHLLMFNIPTEILREIQAEFAAHYGNNPDTPRINDLVEDVARTRI